MVQKRVGVAPRGANSGAVLEAIERAEELGIQAAWLAYGRSGARWPDRAGGRCLAHSRYHAGDLRDTDVSPPSPWRWHSRCR